MRSSEIMVLFKGLANEPRDGAANGAVNGAVNGTVNGAVSGPVNGPVNGPVKSTEQIILNAISNNPRITKVELAKITGKGRTTITREMKKLVSAGVIERVGSDKTDHWELIE